MHRMETLDPNDLVKPEHRRKKVKSDFPLFEDLDAENTEKGNLSEVSSTRPETREVGGQARDSEEPGWEESRDEIRRERGEEFNIPRPR